MVVLNSSFEMCSDHLGFPNHLRICFEVPATQFTFQWWKQREFGKPQARAIRTTCYTIIIVSSNTTHSQSLNQIGNGHFQSSRQINDNLTSVLQARPAVLPVLPLAKFNFDILVLLEGPELHSIAYSDASRCGAKKDDEIRLIVS